MSVTLREIREDDLENIMRWRMAEDITRYMNTNPKLTLEGQVRWLASIRQNPDVQYWMIEVDGEPAGVINLTGLTKPDGNLGWAYYVGEKRLRSIQTALALEMSMYDYALIELGKTAVYSDVFTLNAGVIQLHKLCGCEVVEERKQAVLKEGIYYDVTYMRMSAERWREIRTDKKYEKIIFPKPGDTDRKHGGMES
jgi:UDP-4-amino-4,6-dideoxy-N-acetyl-beta-L-altrosamine N-acetyltransferase